MSNNNELTIKINFSDDLLTKVTNMLLLSSSPTPLGVMLPQVATSATKDKSPSKPIGFKK